MKLLTVLMTLCFSILADASVVPTAVRPPDDEGFFKVSETRKLYAKVYRGNPELPAIVSINGLTQDTDHWVTNVEELLKTGRTLVFYDTEYQGRTLENFVDRNNLWSQLHSRPVVEPLSWLKSFYSNVEPMLPPVSIEQDSRDLRTLLRRLGIQKASIAGLSFGGAVAIQYASDYPHLIEQIFAEAPYTEPQAEQDLLIRYLMGAVKRTFPLIRWNDDDLYDLIFRGIVFSTYHQAEPTILKWGPFQIFGVAEKARGVRHMNTAVLAQRFPKRSFNLIMAGLDAYIQRDVHMRFWESVPKESRSSIAVIEGVEHKMNESVGPFLGAWVRTVLEGKNQVRSGKAWQGFPEKGVMQTLDGKIKIAMPQVSPCENALRPILPNTPNLAVDRIARSQSENLFGWFRSFMPPQMRETYDKTTKFWRGL